WQWDVFRPGDADAPPEAAPGLLGFNAPQALDETGRPLAGQVLLQWQPDAPVPHLMLADRIHRPYPTASLDDPAAVLSARDFPEALPRVIPRQDWRFGRQLGGAETAPDERYVWLAGGFQPGVIYELLYTTRICPVVGTGLLALRDAVSYLRYGGAEEGNPCAGRLRHVLGYGSSQCGRLLRTFLYQGLNLDEAGREAFDGLLIGVAGARRGEFNHRYAQPSVIKIPSFAFLPPFDYEALLARQRQRGGVPRIVAVNTSSEYWNREASLLHTDPTGQWDVEPPEDVRLYHFAGTKHGPGALGAEAETETEDARLAGRARRHANVVDYQPLQRAALFHLERWVTEGTPPPPSVFPRLADGSAARPEEVLASFGAIPGADPPDPQRLIWRRAVDLGAEAERGVGRYPPREHGEPYRWYVPAVDADGNEKAGIALPDIAVPVAAHTGWSARPPAAGGPGQNRDMLGNTLPFAPDAPSRRRWEDPRPSIAERYASRETYLSRVAEVARRLVQTGYLLAEDEALVVRNAGARYDAFARAPAAPD
ncbi:MAG TPA: alpha/beta hydrolase domain-containing protein, partial [Chloroflexota bacterium]|nr:alpha/beta hydrolase domain-containing protein [Chloroflexota bacterium]